jgi:CheY-like chemotaxis protein
MPNRNTLRVLVVEDVADAADMLSMLLRTWGYRTRVCYGGAAALELARGYRPQVVLLDIGMPGTDGFAVARGLRKMPGLEGAVLIGISGYADEASRHRALASGFDHYLVKPGEPAHLKVLLSRSVRSTPTQAPGEPRRRALKERRYCSGIELSHYREQWLSGPTAAKVFANATTLGEHVQHAGTADSGDAESMPGVDGMGVNEEVGSVVQA